MIQNTTIDNAVEISQVVNSISKLTPLQESIKNYMNECRHIAESRQYRVSGVFNNRDALTDIQIQDKRLVRILGCVSLNNLINALPKEYYVQDGNITKTYPVQFGFVAYSLQF